MFNLYIKQAAEIFGVTHTREIYEKAIEVLPDEQARWVATDGNCTRKIHIDVNFPQIKSF